jgi:hypothetical protein
MMSDPNFTARKLQWLEALAADTRLHHGSLVKSVAIIYALRYVNVATGDGWVGTQRLARDLNTDRRSCQRALDTLGV